MTTTAVESILIVDDDPAIRIPLSMKLRSVGFHVLEATDGIEALQQLQAGPADLAIIDVGMPRMDGYTLCQRLRENERTRATPVIILTAQDLSVPADVIAKIGQHVLVNKPFSPREIVQMVRQLLLAAKGA